MHFDAVDDDFDVVCLVAVHHHTELYLTHFAIHTHTGESRLADVLKQFAVMAFAATDSRGKNVDALAVKFLENQVGDLFFGVAHHLFARVVGIGLTNSGIEKAQEVVYFGDGAHRRARVFVH